MNYLEKISFDHASPTLLRINFSGDWQISTGLPAISTVISEISGHKDISQITFNVSRLQKWDSGFVSFLFQLLKECEHRKIRIIRDELPQGVQKLLGLALKVHEEEIVSPKVHEPFFQRVGSKVLVVYRSIFLMLNFLGEITLAFVRLFARKAYFRRDEFIGIVQKCGADALPLVSLISFLVGIILAFIGAIQLKLFGAQIYIADIVGIGMVRVMGAVMTGILMAGRTGASFAAELGIMQVNEEIDALKTLGISPVEFLVMPRILALVIMMPILTLYADFMGILGGLAISTGLLGLNPVEYWQHTQTAVKLSNLWVGLIHGFTFGIIIAVTGCLQGIKCERNATAVGEATTSAVVEGIMGIVIATAIITFICQVLGV